MQTVQQNNNDLSWPAAAWRGLVKLDFISNFFTWLMEALARITEPLASFSAIYIIIVAGVPVLFVDRLYTLALALIIGSPELLIVGAFKIASREIRTGNQKGWYLIASCGVLLALTAVTVGDLFVWHWHQDAVNILMGCRCLAGIAYTFTRGIVTDGNEPVDVSPNSPVQQVLAGFTATITASMQTTVNQLLAEVHGEQQKVLAEVHVLVGQMRSEQQALLFTVNEVQQGVNRELHGAIEVFGQQSQAALESAVERIERANSRRLEGVYSRLEQVRITLESNPSLPAVNATSSLLGLPSHVSSQQFQRVHGEPVAPGQFHSAGVNPDDGLLEGTKVDAGQAFAVNHYRVNACMPSLAQIMAATACGKTLASRARNRAAAELGLMDVSVGE